MPETAFRGTPMLDLRGYMKPSEIEKLIAAARSERDRLLLEILWVTGARISEVVGDKGYATDKGEREAAHGLRSTDLIREEKIVILQTLKRRVKSVQKAPERRVVIPQRIMDRLIRFIKKGRIAPDARVFPITRQRAFQIIRNLGKRAGVKNVGKKQIHPHHFRHSHCVAYIKKNNTMEGLRELQDRLDHVHFSTTAHYLQFATEGRAKKIEEVFG